MSAGPPTIGRGGPGAAIAAAALQALLLASARLAPGAAPGREADPAAWAFAALWCLWTALEAGLALPGREPARLSGTDRALAALTGGALLAGAWLGLWTAPAFTPGSLALAAATALLAGGIALRVAAVRQLGASFATGIHADTRQPLVTHGVYRRIRHPSEAGLIVAAIAAAVLLRSAAALALAALAVVPAAVARSRREDRALAAAHGEAHAAWRRRAGMLLPRVGRG